MTADSVHRQTPLNGLTTHKAPASFLSPQVGTDPRFCAFLSTPNQFFHYFLFFVVSHRPIVTHFTFNIRHTLSLIPNARLIASSIFFRAR